ncbi:MAG: nucleotidyltransferase domain-containing protein [Endomicrobium sp.]|jgi:predicted nucleotidyltransferase|nr:nucleotidyltransferase domain-containing protein [Endomicrobium sp.]
MKHGLPDSAVDKINSVFAKHKNIKQAILYGSRAKGTDKTGSDIDLTLDGDIEFQELLQVSSELDDLLLPWMIDLSIYSNIGNENLKDHIKRVGKVLYKKIL